MLCSEIRNCFSRCWATFNFFNREIKYDLHFGKITLKATWKGNEKNSRKKNYYIHWTDAEVPKLWSPDTNSQLIGKDPDDGKDWRREEKGGDRGWNIWIVSLTPMDMSLSELHREMVKDREVLHATVHGVAKSQTWLRHWETATTRTHTHTHPDVLLYTEVAKLISNMLQKE